MRRTIFIGLIVLGVGVMGDASGAPTREQAEKLVAAAWKAPPASMDVTYYITVEWKAQTEQEVREDYERIFDKLEGPKEELSGGSLRRREREVELNVRRVLKEQQEGGRKIKHRIRFDGNCYRIDKVLGRPETTLQDNDGRETVQPGKILDTNTPFDRSVIKVMDQNGAVERFEYSHQGKNATRRKINDKEGEMIKGKVVGIMSNPSGLLLRIKLGTSTSGLPSGPYDVNETKVEQLCSGTLDGMSIEIGPDEDTPNERDKIKLSLYGGSNSDTVMLKTTMICDREDYSKVYYYEAVNPATNQTVSTRTCSDFDGQGLPHNVTIVGYDMEGKVEQRERYRIEDAHINVPIGKEVFELRPPSDYEIVEIDADGNPTVVRKGGGISHGMRELQEAFAAKDVEAIKGLLSHDTSLVRVGALKGLERLLSDDPGKLKKAVILLLDDQEPQVRAAAAKVVKQVERMEQMQAARERGD